MVSSTPLQMILYYNVFFSVAYFLVNLLVLRWKLLNEDGLMLEVFTPFLFALWALVEVYRLYLGYSGNLREQVPQLAGFLFISVFPQTVFVFFFLLIQKPRLPLDEIAGYVLLVFIGLELLLGYWATQAIIQNKTARFAVEYGDQGAPSSSPPPEGQRSSQRSLLPEHDESASAAGVQARTASRRRDTAPRWKSSVELISVKED